MPSIPAAFAKTIIEVHGEAGQAWLDDLPVQLRAVSSRWGLELEEPFANLSYNYVMPVTRTDGRPAVLKAGVPNAEQKREGHALRAFDGDGIAKLLEWDEDGGFLLIERLLPGRMLTEQAEEEAIKLAAGLMKRLWRKPPKDHSFPDLAEWTQGIEKLKGFPAELTKKSQLLREKLLASAPAPMLLHGDIHHFNILSAEREPWLAIDPKGVVGDPAFDIAAFLMNPDFPDASTLNQRIQIFAKELHMNEDRIRMWAAVQAVLSAWWTFEDHGHISDDALAYAEVAFQGL